MSTFYGGDMEIIIYMEYTHSNPLYESGCYEIRAWNNLKNDYIVLDIYNDQNKAITRLESYKKEGFKISPFLLAVL